MTNNVITTKQTKKNPLDVEAGKYRLWEKLRRDRFNAGLESLSASLPDYEAGVSKWTKGDIVERALNYIKALQAQRIPDDLQRRIKGLKRQNSKLREIIRSKLAKKMDPKEFSKLNLQEIQSLINKFEEAESKKENVSIKPTIGGEDHSYSLCSQGTPEPDLEVTSEEIIEDVPPAPVVDSTSIPSSPLISSGTTLTLKPITIISTTPGAATALLNPTSWTLPQHSLIAIDPNQIVSSASHLMMRPLIKLPLPRLKNTFVKKTEEKKTAKSTTTDKTKPKTSQKPPPLSAKEDSASDCTEEESAEKVDLPSTNLDEFDLKASSTLPDAILASEDPLAEEVIEEVDISEDLPPKQAKEEPEKSTTPPKEMAKPQAAMPKPSPKVLPEAQKVQSSTKSKNSDKVSGVGKKSKSSYSIAALCQISVNIGGDALVAPESMVNSPGVVSLNSVGTASPSVTPAPPTPPAPTPPIEKKETDKVIQELKPVQPPVALKHVVKETPLQPIPPNTAMERTKASALGPTIVPQKGVEDFKPSSSSVSKTATPKKVEVMTEANKVAPSVKEAAKKVEYIDCNKSVEKSNYSKKDNMPQSSTKSSKQQWSGSIQPQVQVNPQNFYQHQQVSPQTTPSKDAATDPSCSNTNRKSSIKDSSVPDKNIQYTNSTKVPPSQSHSHQTRGHVHQSQGHQGYLQGYSSSPSQGQPIQSSISQVQSQMQHSQVQQQQQVEFHYGNSSSSSTVMNEFLGHPLQTPPSSGGLSSSVSQFHETNNTANNTNHNNHHSSHRYNYNPLSSTVSSSNSSNTSYQNNNTHQHVQQSTNSLDYPLLHHHHHHQQQQSNSTSTNSNNNPSGSNHQGLQNEQYFPYNRSYYTASQNHYGEQVLPSSSSKGVIQQQHFQGSNSTHQMNSNNSLMQQPNTFSVNQLVSSNNSAGGSKSQRKAPKRSTSSTAPSYELPIKKANRSSSSVANNMSSSEKESRLKDDKKVSLSSSKTSRSSSSNKPSLVRSKGNYSAESLIMDPSQYNLQNMDFQLHQQQVLQGNKSKMDIGWIPSSGGGVSSTMMTSDGSVVPSGSQFCSMSPSPFGQDLEFGMFISGNESYGSSSQIKNNFHKAGNSGNNKMTTGGGSQVQNIIFDNSNLFPLPTLTPPAVVEDPYAGFMNPSSSQLHHHQSHHNNSVHHQHTSYHNHSSTTSNSSKQTGGYSANTHKHFSSSSTPPTASGRFNNVSDYSSLSSNNTNNNQQPNVAGVPSTSSSLVNFNLSTIFPEINEKFSGAASTAAAVLVPPTSASSSSSSQATTSTKAIVNAPPTSAIIPSVSSSTDFRQASIPSASGSELLPHSIAMLGHGNTGQQSMTSMAFNSGSTSISGLHYHQQSQQ